MNRLFQPFSQTETEHRPPFRRHRARPVDLPAPCRTDGRIGPRRKRVRQRFDLHRGDLPGVGAGDACGDRQRADLAGPRVSAAGRDGRVCRRTRTLPLGGGMHGGPLHRRPIPLWVSPMSLSPTLRRRRNTRAGPGIRRPSCCWRVGIRPPPPGVTAIVTRPVRKAALLGAVAIAAGRASPEIAGSARPGGRVRVPSVEEALRQNRLILVADDHPINRQVILRQLNRLGYAAEAVKDGIEALKALAQKAVCDAADRLPHAGIDGFELTDRIRATSGAADGRGFRSLRSPPTRCSARRSAASPPGWTAISPSRSR